MMRMGFGLNVAPKFIDVLVVRWITQEFPGVDSYVDDVLMPSVVTSRVSRKLQQHGLPTKDPEPMASSLALGLRLAEDDAGQVCPSRQEGAELTLAERTTKHAVFNGVDDSQVTSLQVLEEACQFDREMGCGSLEHVQQFCHKVAAKLTGDGDPARSLWHVRPYVDIEAIMWFDASDLALDVVLDVHCDTV